MEARSLAAKAQRPKNVIGMHFFNPAAILKLVEVVSGLQTSIETAQTVHACNSYNEINVAHGLSIEFERSAKVGDQLFANAVEQSNDKRIRVCQVLVTNSENKLVAILSGK